MTGEHSSVDRKGKPRQFARRRRMRRPRPDLGARFIPRPYLPSFFIARRRRCRALSNSRSRSRLGPPIKHENGSRCDRLTVPRGDGSSQSSDMSTKTKGEVVLLTPAESPLVRETKNKEGF